MDSISATPRNRLMGLLADGVGGLNDFASKPFGYDNPPGRMLAQLLGLPAVANTANELSYGGAMGTGKGMTWKPKADTVDAALALAPLVAAAPAAINRGAAAVGRRLEAPVSALVDRTMARGGRGADLLQGMAQGTQSPLTVWHGSPHKFDKFDASKIGTGEGAQAYGHGLYLAENPGVAEQYQKTLSNDGFLVGDKVFDPMKEIQHKNVKFWAGKGDLEGAIMTAEKIASSDSPVANLAKSDLVRLREIEKAGGISRNPGALYKVDLPDEHIAKMLDWDKPLSQQHPVVQKALNGIETNFPEIPDFNLRKWMDADPLASTWHNVLQRDLGADPAMITGTLKDRGIPGIRYLDGGSRGTGAGTSNFVVFPGNEDILKIMERNGKGLLAD